MSLTRRQFLAATAALTATPFTRSIPCLAADNQADEFCFPVLGDIHFDRLAHHDMNWLNANKPKDLSQIERYSRITDEVLPHLLNEVKEQVAAATTPVPFIVQVGDLVEGLCGTPTLARRHCEEAVAMIADAKLGAPMFITKGNHDITGPGAPEAYRDVLLPFMNHPMRNRSLDANFVVRQRNTTLMFFDAYDSRSLEWAEEILSERDPASGWLFFVIHPPIVPYTARCWHVYNRPDQLERRSRLLASLGRHRPVVLNGHLHKYGLLNRRIDLRGLMQFATISVIPRPDMEAKQERRGRDAYGAELVELEPRFSPSTVEQRRQTLAAEAEHITAFDYADAPGYAIVHVSTRRVWADVYIGLGRRLWKTVTLCSAPWPAEQDNRSRL